MSDVVERVLSTDRRWHYRHRTVVRVTHWINAVCLAVLLMSGLQIFNAHPALYLGEDSHFADPLLQIEDGFPGWITVPGYRDLATGRLWHFFFAWLFVLNGLAYLAAGVYHRHFYRDLVPSRSQLRHIGPAIRDHVRLRFPEGDEARHYNVLQKLSYLSVVFVLLPVMLLAGLAMSPALDAAFPWLTSMFGGRQSARTVHFVVANLILLFVVVHVFMVLVSGVWNNLRSMITGWYAIKHPSTEHERDPSP
jgi:thiosulfate reductase cytochrome b subunit